MMVELAVMRCTWITWHGACHGLSIGYDRQRRTPSNQAERSVWNLPAWSHKLQVGGSRTSALVSFMLLLNRSRSAADVLARRSAA